MAGRTMQLARRRSPPWLRDTATDPDLTTKRAKDEGGLASVVRVLLTAFSFFLLIPPWGFIVWFFA